MSATTAALEFRLNGEPVRAVAAPSLRLSHLLREELGLFGTKTGCDAGDCGVCTVLLDGEPVCACLTPAARIQGRHVETVEGLERDPLGRALQQAFLLEGGSQCGFCTPGMLMAALALLRRKPRPDAAAVEEALGGVLCRCTGYRHILNSVLRAAELAAGGTPPCWPERPTVGVSVPRLDGPAKVAGRERFGADGVPAGALVVRLLRCPHPRARFRFGDLESWRQRHPGVRAVLTARDIPGANGFGVILGSSDQPVFAEEICRFRGEPVAAVVATSDAAARRSLEDFPVVFEPLTPLLDPEEALRPEAPLVRKAEDNRLASGIVRRGDIERGFAEAAAVVEGRFRTSFIEHAYLEPEAGWARLRQDGRIELHVSTQTPHMDREAVAEILGLPEDRIIVVPTAVGGGFGGKLDLSVQPYLALAALRLARPVRMIYARRESMMATTKRHAARLSCRIGADREGRILAFDFFGLFDTGAYASWGPTVAGRVPVHAGGPYRIPAYCARSLAVYTNHPPAGAFRGFGVPQAAIASETLYDELARRLGLDPLELRRRNALRDGDTTVTGQMLERGVGYLACLDALAPHWRDARARARIENARAQRKGVPRRRGVGIAGGFYGCGNTALPNPSTIRAGIRADGTILLFQGAVDIGQGSNTVIPQIFAEALGVPLSRVRWIVGDTERTPDAGKTSASRQTVVSGQAAIAAARALRRELARLANASEEAEMSFEAGRVRIREADREVMLELARLPADGEGFVVQGQGRWDPPTSPLDGDGQGAPYAVYGFAAQLCELEVDLELGTVRLLRFVAAHDVGRAINPLLVEGQIHGGIAQGIGLALLEEFRPGVSENLHDYLIPSFSDVPEIETVLVESGDPLGPFGAKGVGEHALIPTAPAILNALRDAVGAPVRALPATPERVLEAVRSAQQEVQRS